MGILDALSGSYDVEGVLRYLLDYSFTDAKQYKHGVVLKEENLCFIFDIIDEAPESGDIPDVYGLDPYFDKEDWGLENFDELGGYIPNVIDNDNGTEYVRYSGYWFLMNKKSGGRNLWRSALQKGYVCVLCTLGDDYTGSFTFDISDDLSDDSLDDVKRSYVLDIGQSIESKPSLCVRLADCFCTLYGRNQYLIYPVCNYLKSVDINELSKKIKGYTISNGKFKLPY